jgi:hypothetical protein
MVKKKNKSNKPSVPQNGQRRISNEEQLRKRGKKPILYTLLIFWGKAVLAISLLAFTLFIISYLFFFPEPYIKIVKTFDSPKMISYEIQIMNRDMMDIHQLTAAFRFDENYPVLSCYLDEPQYKTGFVLKHGFVSRLTASVGEERVEKPFYNPIKYSSGVQAITDKLSPDSSATLYVNIDKSYAGPKDQIFPIALKPSLRSNSYFLTYKYMPLGELAPIAITRGGCYDFKNNETEADNYGKIYKQEIIGPDGKNKIISFSVNKDAQQSPVLGRAKTARAGKAHEPRSQVAS